MSAKVVFVNRFFWPDLSATSQMLTDLAFRLAQAGVEVHVVTSRQLYENPAASLPATEQVRGVHVHRVWTAKFGRKSLRGRALDYLSFYLTATARLGRLLRAGDVAVIKTDPPMLSVFAAPVVFVRGARLINWLQDVFPEVASRLGVARLNPFVDATLTALRDRSLRFASTNIVLGPRMRDYFVGRGIDKDSLQIIENWADGHALVPRPTSLSTMRESLGLRGHFVVGYSGNLGQAHEYETMLAAANALRQHRDITFLMIGGGAKMHAMKHAVEASGLDNIRFLPYQPRESLTDSFAAADVHLACLRPELEGFVVPSKVYGILAAGRPAIFIGDLKGDIGQLVDECDCGYAVTCGDGAGLAQKILSLRDNPTLAAQLGTRARSVFEARFTLDRAVQKWLVLLGAAGLKARAQSGMYELS